MKKAMKMTMAMRRRRSGRRMKKNKPTAVEKVVKEGEKKENEKKGDVDYEKKRIAIQNDM